MQIETVEDLIEKLKELPPGSKVRNGEGQPIDVERSNVGGSDSTPHYRIS